MVENMTDDDIELKPTIIEASGKAFGDVITRYGSHYFNLLQ